MTPQEFQRLKTKMESLEDESSRAQGAIDQILQTLEQDHGCKTIESAEEKLKKLKQQVERDEARLEREWAKFKKKWGEKI